jgi:hypothetical protein
MIFRIIAERLLFLVDEDRDVGEARQAAVHDQGVDQRPLALEHHAAVA